VVVVRVKVVVGVKNYLVGVILSRVVILIEIQGLVVGLCGS